ncbi:hypothetical protein [uncultured Sphingomonas sp.]|uniref:hypothetical protein n=1 Tax=uncultured Sphingomonas sp. TaxID=158754 RepID=UPI0026247291|nr:hypothetical protein [uncultured Sphingomonas sp.]
MIVIGFMSGSSSTRRRTPFFPVHETPDHAACRPFFTLVDIDVGESSRVVKRNVERAVKASAAIELAHD